MGNAFGLIMKWRAGPQAPLPVELGVCAESNALGSTKKLRKSDRILLADDLPHEAAVAFFGSKVLLNLPETSRCKNNSRLSVD